MVIRMMEKTAQEKVCETCKFFYRHYTRRGRYYIETQFGHCSRPRIKIRTEEQTCVRWTPRPIHPPD